jgi:hypothetical protein
MVLSPSSGILMLIGFHSFITVVTPLLSLSIEGQYETSKNTIFWDVMVFK